MGMIKLSNYLSLMKQTEGGRRRAGTPQTIH